MYNKHENDFVIIGITIPHSLNLYLNVVIGYCYSLSDMVLLLHTHTHFFRCYKDWANLESLLWQLTILNLYLACLIALINKTKSMSHTIKTENMISRINITMKMVPNTCNAVTKNMGINCKLSLKLWAVCMATK